MTSTENAASTSAATRLASRIEALCADAAAFQLAVDDPAIRQMGRIVADTVGVINAGGRSPQLRRLVAGDSLYELVRPAGTCAVLVPPYPRADAASAAWINGAAAAFLELDEGVRPTGHPAAHVVPAALATAQATHSTGLNFLTAAVAGYEVAARLFEAFTLSQAMHPHGHFGVLGAAVAVARLRGTDPVAAVRIAATQPLWTGWEACYIGATARNFWSGHANRAGVEACVMADAGLTGATESLASLVLDDLQVSDAIDAPVTAASLKVHRNYFKFHSACALNHGALDAVMALHERMPDLEVRDIARVEVSTISRNLRINRVAHPNELSTRFSIPYAVAAALVRGHTGPDAFDWDAEVADLATRVTVTADPDRDGWPETAPATVSIVLNDAVVTETALNPFGHHANPPGTSALQRKFAALMTDPLSPTTDEAIDQLYQQLTDLAAVADMALVPVHLPPCGTDSRKGT